jgi:hypothetical protein
MPQPGTPDEIRTRRLVVTDDGGSPRIVAEVIDGIAELRASTGDPQTHVLLYAGPGQGDDSEAIGIELFIEGNSVARVHAWSQSGCWRWNVTSEP